MKIPNIITKPKPPIQRLFLATAIASTGLVLLALATVICFGVLIVVFYILMYYSAPLMGVGIITLAVVMSYRWIEEEERIASSNDDR